MRIRRRTAVLLCALALLLALAGIGWRLLQPDHLRALALKEISRVLRPGYEAELDALDYDLWDGVLRAEGLRIVRLADGRREVLGVGRAEASTRLWQFFSNLTVTDLRVWDLRVVTEVDGDGRITLADAFRASAAPITGSHPRIRVEGGLLRVALPGILADGGEVRLALGNLEWQESRDGGATALTGTLRELGDAGGAGKLGTLYLLGEVSLGGPGTRGIRGVVERFSVDGALLRRLAPALRERLEEVGIEGTFGEGPDAPALELEARSGEDGPSLNVLLRPRGARFLVKSVPVPLTEASGTLSWAGAERTLRIRDFSLRLRDAEIRVEGALAGLGGDFTGRLGLWVRGLVLDRALHDALPAEVRDIWDAYGLEGAVDITAAGPGEPSSFDSYLERTGPGQPLRVGVTVGLRDTSMTFNGYEEDGVREGFAWPVEHMTGRVVVDWTEGEPTVVRLHDLAGRHGDATVRAHGEVTDFGNGRAAVKIVIEAENLLLDDDVVRATKGMEDLFARFSPSGRVARLKVIVEQVPDADTTVHESLVSLDFDGDAGFRYRELPLRLDGVTGHVDYRKDLLGGKRVPVVALQGLRARADGGGDILVDGSVEGEEDPRLRLFITGRDVPLDGPLEAALRATPGAAAAVTVWDRLRPGGMADFTAEITGLESARREEYLVELRGISAQGWGGVRYPLRDLEGTVEVRPEEVVIRNVRGQGAEGPIAVSGRIRDPGGEAPLELTISAEDALIDESLRESLGAAAEAASGYFDVLRPAPGLRGDVMVHLSGKGESLEPVIEATRVRGGIRPLDMRNLDIADGNARFADGLVTGSGITGAMGDREFLVRSARFDLPRGRGSMELEIRRLRFPRDLLGIVEEGTVEAIEKVTPDRFFHVDTLTVDLSEEFRTIALDGVVSFSPTRPGRDDGLGLRGDFDLEELTFRRKGAEAPWVELSGAVALSRGELRPGFAMDGLKGRIELGGHFGPGGNRAELGLSGFTGTVEGRTLRDASGLVSVNDEGVLLSRLLGTVAGGQLGGWIQFHPGGGYRGTFSLSGAHARDLLTPEDPSETLKGRVSAGLDLVNKSGRIDRMGGKIWVEITEGSLFRVPVFESIYGILNIDSPEFTGGTFKADISGDRMRIGTFDLNSSVLSLHKAPGGSFLWLDGRVDLKLTPEVKGVFTTWPLSWIAKIVTIPLSPVVNRFTSFRVSGSISKPVVESNWLDFLKTRKEDRPMLPTPDPATRAESRPSWEF